MKRKKTLFYLMFCIFIWASFSYVSNASANGVKQNGTSIASVMVEDKSEQEMRQMLTKHIKEWMEEDDVVIKSDFQRFTIPRTAFAFNIESTIEAYQEKTKRKLFSFFMKPKNVHIPLQVDFNPETEEVKQLKGLTYIDSGQILDKAIANASELSHESIKLSYIDSDEIPFTTISEVTIDAADISDTWKQILLDLDGTSIDAHNVFSFLQDVSRKKINFSEEEGTFIASHLYKLFVQTNFQIAERHSTNNTPKDVESGLEASVDQAKKQDLSVLNPNNVSFLLSVSTDNHDEKFTIALRSASHTDTYTSEIYQTDIEPRTIYRYSKEVNPGEQVVVQEGKAGKRILVNRLTYNQNHVLLKKEQMSNDLYHATPEIVLMSPKGSSADESSPEEVAENTINDELTEMEEFIQQTEEDMEDVQTEHPTNKERSNTLENFKNQLNYMDEQQAALTTLIANLQKEMKDNEETASDDLQDKDTIEKLLKSYYEKIEKRLDDIESRLQKLEKKHEEITEDIQKEEK